MIREVENSYSGPECMLCWRRLILLELLTRRDAVAPMAYSLEEAPPGAVDAEVNGDERARTAHGR